MGDLEGIATPRWKPFVFIQLQLNRPPNTPTPYSPPRWRQARSAPAGLPVKYDPRGMHGDMSDYFSLCPNNTSLMMEEEPVLVNCCSVVDPGGGPHRAGGGGGGWREDASLLSVRGHCQHGVPDGESRNAGPHSCQPLHARVSQSACLSACLSLCLSASLPVCVCLSVSQSVCYLAEGLSIYLLSC